jgi:hypothetical protein
VRAKESGQADEMLCPLTDDGIAVASTPITSNDTTPDTAISWYDLHNMPYNCMKLIILVFLLHYIVGQNCNVLLHVK